MPKEGMSASEHSRWLDKEQFKVEGFLATLFENFVVRSPAFGLSAKGRDLYMEYSMIGPKDFKALWDELCKGLSDSECLIGKTRKEVKEHITRSTLLNFDETPASLSEAFCIGVVKTLKEDELYRKYFSALSIESSKGKSQVDIHRDSEERWSIVYVNKLFRHLRNGLAHARYIIVSCDNIEYYIIEDETGDEITARMILSRERLNTWISLLTANKSGPNSPEGKKVDVIG